MSLSAMWTSKVNCEVLFHLACSIDDLLWARDSEGLVKTLADIDWESGSKVVGAGTLRFILVGRHMIPPGVWAREMVFAARAIRESGETVKDYLIGLPDVV